MEHALATLADLDSLLVRYTHLKTHVLRLRRIHNTQTAGELLAIDLVVLMAFAVEHLQYAMLAVLGAVRIAVPGQQQIRPGMFHAQPQIRGVGSPGWNPPAFVKSRIQHITAAQHRGDGEGSHNPHQLASATR